MKISIIKAYPKNAKIHDKKQIALIAASIKRFGFDSPIIIDKNNEVIAGHGRLEAAKLLGLLDVPVIRKEKLTADEVKAYRLADNKIAESGWDMKLVLEELIELGPELIDLTGFSSDLLLGADEKDDVLPEKAPAVAKLGDVWALGDHRLMCGDSTNKEAVARLMDGKKADMVFTDPPWNVAIGGDKNPRHRQREGLVNDDLGQEFHVFLEGFAKYIIEFNTGDVYCVMGCAEWPTIHKALTDVGLHWSSTVIWAKDIFVLGRSKYHSQYEPIWYGWSDKSSYHGGRAQSDLWTIPRPKRSEDHPTMKPVALVEKAIVNSSEKGDIVLDLFLGGGSSLIAAEKASRVCYGMEISPKYVDVCIKRWSDYTGKKAKKI